MAFYLSNRPPPPTGTKAERRAEVERRILARFDRKRAAGLTYDEALRQTCTESCYSGAYQRRVIRRNRKR